MKLILDYELLSLDGTKPLLDLSTKEALTLRTLLINAVLDPIQAKGIDPKQKLERHQLALKILNAEKYFEPDYKESQLLHELVGKVYDSPLIVGQVLPILEKGHHPLITKEEVENGDKSTKN